MKKIKINPKIELALIMVTVYIALLNIHSWIKHETLERYHKIVSDENFYNAVKQNNIVAIQKLAYIKHMDFQKRLGGEIVETSSGDLPKYSMVTIQEKTSPLVITKPEKERLKETLPYRKYYNGNMYVIFPMSTDTENISYVFFASLIP